MPDVSSLRRLLEAARMRDLFWSPNIPEQADLRVTGSVWWRDEDGYARIPGYKPHYVDADLLIAAVNALPALLDVAEAAKAWAASGGLDDGMAKGRALREVLARLEKQP